MDITTLNPLERALVKFGSQSAIADKLGISPQAVQQWKYIPAKWALDFESLSNGDITAREILEYLKTKETAG